MRGARVGVVGIAVGGDQGPGRAAREYVQVSYFKLKLSFRHMRRCCNNARNRLA